VDWFNNRHLLEPIGNIPPAEAEAQFYAALETDAMAAQLTEINLRQTRRGSLEHPPFDQRRQLHQLMLRINHVDQTRAEQIVFFLGARAVLHGQNRNGRVSVEIIQNTAGHGEQDHNISA